MKYENLQLQDLMIDMENIDFDIWSTDELINDVDSMREKLGYTDLVGNDENDVYYNFNLICNLEEKDIAIVANCNNSEHDDFEHYELPLTAEEKTNLLYQVIEKLVLEVADEV